MSPVNKCIEREKKNRARGNKLLLNLHVVYFQNCKHFDRPVLALTRPRFWPTIHLSAWR